MIRTAIALALILALSGCERTPAAPDEGATILRDTDPNLLTMLNGATVVDRTGEASLQLSAIHAIDGDHSTVWATPPDDLEQTVTIALGREVMVKRLGIHFGSMRTTQPAGALLFEGSLGGAEFTPLGTIEAQRQPENWLEIEPIAVSHLRVTILRAFAENSTSAQVPTLLADGETQLLPPVPDLRGHWRINNFEATISTAERVIQGVTTEDPPRVFRGAWDGRAVRLSWSRGLEHGVGLLVAEPEGKALNAIMWHLKAHPPFATPVWFGERSGKPEGVVTAPSIKDAFFRTEGRFPMHDLVFDGAALLPGSEQTLRSLVRLIEANPAGTFRFAAHYVSEGTEREDIEMSKRRLDSLRGELERLGLAPDLAGYDAAARRDLRDLPWTQVELLLNNRIDLELTRHPGE
ncbi:MAG: discoidin domain-containing protein [Thermoanaerobaculia bacterium]